MYLIPSVGRQINHIKKAKLNFHRQKKNVCLLGWWGSRGEGQGRKVKTYSLLPKKKGLRACFPRSAIPIHQTHLIAVVWTPFCLSKWNLKDFLSLYPCFLSSSECAVSQRHWPHPSLSTLSRGLFCLSSKQLVCSRDYLQLWGSCPVGLLTCLRSWQNHCCLLESSEPYRCLHAPHSSPSWMINPSPPQVKEETDETPFPVLVLASWLSWPGYQFNSIARSWKLATCWWQPHPFDWHFLDYMLSIRHFC